MKKLLAVVLCTAVTALTLPLSGCASCSRSLPQSSSQAEVARAEVSASMPAQTAVSSEVPVASSEPSEPSAPAEALPALSMSVDMPALQALPNELVKWGPGTAKDEFGRSTACVDLQEKYGEKYNAFFIAPMQGNTITLSFDQGYENGYTTPILDALKEKNVQAIFFLTGHYVRSQPELVQRMIDEGHILGSHSDNHKVYCSELSIDESIEDAKWMQDHLRENFNYEMRIFRFPEGLFSEQSLALVQQLGYQSVFWSFGYSDWNPDNQPEPAAALERITSYLHPGEIMLLHSVSKTNAEILPQVIDIIREKGYDIGMFKELAVEGKREIE